MKTSFIATLLVLNLLSMSVFAQVEYFRIGQGHTLAYEYIPAKNQQKTLILLPGVNRALSTREASVKLLLDKGWGVLLPSLSAQPLSIEGLGSQEEPAFLSDSDLRVEDFAADVGLLVQHLGLKDAVPVSLSYTSTVATYLDPKLFSHVIQTVPMVVSAETNPEASQQAALWESWFRLNPFLAPFWIRSFRDNAYSVHWGQIVDGNLADDPDFYGPEPRVDDIKAGYVTIARAAEDFDLSLWDFSKDSRTHDFFIAGKENPVRLANQVTVIRNYLAAGKRLRVVVASQSDHIIPSSQPSLYAGVIDLLASTESLNGPLVQFVQLNDAKSIKNLKWQGQNELEIWLQANE